MQEKFEKLFHELEIEHMSEDWLNPEQVYFRGSQDIPGANLHCGFQVITKPVELLT